MVRAAKRDDGGAVKRRRRHPMRKLVGWTAAGLCVAAVVQELRKPQDERTWTGQVGGLVPYDLRWPLTEDRVRASLWNPDSEALFTPHAFGVGWSVNFARLLDLAEEAVDTAKR